MASNAIKKLVIRDKTTVTVEDLKKRYPSRSKTITQDLVDMINATNNDPMFNGDEFINSMYTYENAMIKNGSSMKEYINAIKFVGFLMSEGDNYTEAYARARAGDDFVKKTVGKSTDTDEYKALVAAASRYRKNPLVVDILTLVQVPWDIMYAHAAHGAFGVLTKEMVQAPLSKDRIAAAEAVLKYVKPNELKIQMEAGPGALSMGESLSRQLLEVSAMQKKLLESGQDIKSVQRIGINLNDDEQIEDAEVYDE